jgi:hypothetical protein
MDQTVANLAWILLVGGRHVGIVYPGVDVGMPCEEVNVWPGS